MVRVKPDSPPPDTSDARAEAPAPDERATRASLERQLAELTLPVMWSLRQEAVRAFEPLGVRPIRVLVLELISRGFAHPKELADILETVPPAISNMLSDLESRGWLRREPDPEDGRRVRLELTDAGRELLGEVQHRWLDVSRGKLAGLDDDQLRLLIATYRSLLAQEPAS